MASFVVRKDEMWAMTDYEEKGRKTLNIQKNNHAAHTKIEIENVLPTEIEKRSFEIITEELEQEGIVLPEIQAPIQSAAYIPVRI